jgi:DNA-binding NarL/FixJ family response regulator
VRSSAMARMIKLLLVDDQPMVRKALRMRLALEPDFAVVGEASDGAEVVALDIALAPDVVVMDAEMPRTSGFRAASELARAGAGCSVVILSIHDDPATRRAASEDYIAAFVSKVEPFETLAVAIRAAAATRRLPDAGPATTPS